VTVRRRQVLIALQVDKHSVCQVDESPTGISAVSQRQHVATVGGDFELAPRYGTSRAVSISRRE
jgi:hypothetical protein